MQGLATIAALITAAGTLSLSNPNLLLVIVGFLVGAWGQEAKVTIAVIIGIVMIMIGAVGFVLANDTGHPYPGIPGASS